MSRIWGRFFIAVIIFIFLLLTAPAKAAPSEQLIEDFVVGKVISVTEPAINKELLRGAGLSSKQQIAEVRILEGPYKGLLARVVNDITDNPAYNIEIKPNSEVILSITSTANIYDPAQKSSKTPEVNISDYHRAPVIYVLLLAFLFLFLILGGKTGIKALLGLVITVALIALVLLPLSLAGVYPLLTAIVICLTATVASLLLICGLTRKAAAAIIGTVCGVLISGILAYLVIKYAPLTGLSSEEAQILRGSTLAFNQKPAFYQGLLAAGMLIGALGVIMDVAISIASSVYELAKVNKNLTQRELYQSGMNIGRDIMGTMTNTLILAYAGGALPLLLLGSQMPFAKLLNLDLVATEVAAAVSGSFGLISTIPLTALIAAWLMRQNNKAKDNVSVE